MTVYELIQELSDYNSDTEVLVSFENKDKTFECNNCKSEVKIDGDDIAASDYSIRRIGHKIYIEAKE